MELQDLSALHLWSVWQVQLMCFQHLCARPVQDQPGLGVFTCIYVGLEGLLKSCEVNTMGNGFFLPT